VAIRRIVPNIASDRPDLCRDFYVDFLGLEAAMDLGWVATYVSPTNRTAQVTVVRAEEAASKEPSISVEVDEERSGIKLPTPGVAGRLLSWDRRSPDRLPSPGRRRRSGDRRSQVGRELVSRSFHVDRVHAEAVARGLPIVYPPTDEPWGVRRFWVEDPNGVVVNVLSHRESAGSE
jgi:catechol 2,3-dioxygenase-like lactoylglutathione lyase family enzyme